MKPTDRTLNMMVEPMLIDNLNISEHSRQELIMNSIERDYSSVNANLNFMAWRLNASFSNTYGESFIDVCRDAERRLGIIINLKQVTSNRQQFTYILQLSQDYSYHLVWDGKLNVTTISEFMQVKSHLQISR